MKLLISEKEKDSHSSGGALREDAIRAAMSRVSKHKNRGIYMIGRDLLPRLSWDQKKNSLASQAEFSICPGCGFLFVVKP